MLRLFACGFLAVVLALYLSALGFNETRIGLLLTLTFLGDAAMFALAEHTPIAGAGAARC